MKKSKRYIFLIAAALMLFLSGCGNTGASAPPEQQEVSSNLYPGYIYEGGNRIWGYINESGEFDIQPKYSHAEDFNPEGLAAVGLDGKYGVINMEGDYVVKPEYMYIQDIYQGTIIGVKEYNSGYDLIDTKGNVIKEITGQLEKFSEGLALYTSSMDWANREYGYIDNKGNVIIEAQYLWGTPYTEEGAVVKTKDNTFVVLDTKGEILHRLGGNIVSEISEGTVIYRDEATNREGYMTLEGQKITEAVFDQARPLEGGIGEVMITDASGKSLWGLINSNSEFVFQPQFGGIEALGEGFYAVFRPNEYLDWPWRDFLPKALMNQEGQLLSDYIYYGFGEIQEGMKYYSDGISTYITDAAYKPDPNLEPISGIGEVTAEGELLKLELDNDLMYMTREGKEIWRGEYSYPLKEGGSILAKKHRPDRYRLTYYPQLANTQDKALEAELNKILEALFIDRRENTEGALEGYYETMEKGFKPQELGELLTIIEEGYHYSLGGAHGTPWIKSHHFNIKKGKQYKLEDLFIDDSGFSERLVSIIRKEMEGKEEFTYFESAEVNISEEQFFLLTEEGLEIRFQVYEIASYAVGMPSFMIPYEEISDLINTEGELWNSIKAQLNI